MKIRKSILAAATAATVSISGVVAAPAFAAENTGADDGTVTAKENNDGDKPKDEEKTFGEKLVENSSDDKGNLDPKQITAWIAVFTAVLSLIGNVLTFAQKNFNFPKF
ncbi:hypothetical protein SAMN05444817_10723 [Corynebacterium appendicis CIP 107643]|uniref:Secreted protein n=1 Tax=Corynebacterium appendicis CIP 107643 TaxID=1161099 RepID=A0A1N7JFW0_9CORY|nr:hypothetical protein [Corynebacterium appendicis]WJY61250.1 hypothetical protein CAPP_06655 [Corynebacterium appendicis CIP 107643]SIS48199.1 hypothetical protein SAMN05444817_10723 [Corynebacterium appendicis CIP 107643]